MKPWNRKFLISCAKISTYYWILHKCEAKLRLKKKPRQGSPGCICVLSAHMPHVFAHMHVFVLACPSQCSACWHSYLHYPVTVNQSPAPRQPCRLATRVWYTKGRLQPGAKGEKTEGKRKGRSLAPPLAFHLLLFRLHGLHNACLHSLNICQLLFEAYSLVAYWKQLAIILWNTWHQVRMVMTQCHFVCGWMLSTTLPIAKSCSSG